MRVIATLIMLLLVCAKPVSGQTAGPQAETGNFWNVFLKDVHVDGLWTNSSVAGPRTYAVLGTHLTLAHVGRIYIWGPPGVVLLRESDGHLHAAWSYGVEFYVSHIWLPGVGTKGKLYFNITKVWTKDGNPLTSLLAGPNAGLDMIGLSITFR